MSRNMQLTVMVRPYYEKDLEAAFPKLWRYVSALDPGPVEPSLYDLAGQVDQLLYRFDGTRLRKILLRHQDRLKKAHKQVQEHIADWHLAEADKWLYTIEDTFDQIESELD